MDHLEKSVHDVTTTIEEWEDNGHSSSPHSHVEVIVSVIDGKSGGEEGEND